MKKLFIIFLLFITHSSLFITFAQQPTQEWVKRYTDTSAAQWAASSIKMDSLGFIYVLGETQNDFGFLKYNSAGNLLFVANYWPGGYDYGGGSYFDVTPNGDVYMTGLVETNFNEWMYTVKFNSNGAFQWGRLYGVVNKTPSDIKVDKLGNAIIVGAMTIKYNPNGDTLWTRQLGSNQKMALDDSNNIYATGSTGALGECLKYSPSGNLDWYTTFNIDSHPCEGLGINLDLLGNIYVMSESNVPFAAHNDALLKMLNNGQVLWNRLITGIINGQQGGCEYSAGPVISYDGNSIYYITNCYNGTGGGGYSLATIKYDAAGDSQWVQTYSGGVPATDNQPSSIKLDKYGNVYVCGGGVFQTTGYDFVTLRYNPTGIQQWVATYSGEITNGNDIVKDLFVDTNFAVYVTGVSPNTFNGKDAVTIKYDQPIGIISNSNELPAKYTLCQNYPNPFNNSTIISYELPKRSEVQLKIFNSLGQLVKTLVNTEQDASYYTILLNTDDFASGVYFYQLQAGTYRESKKMLLIK